TDVHHRRRMRDRADRDQIYPAVGDLAHVVEGHSSGCFYQSPGGLFADQRNALADVGDLHVVQHYYIGGAGDRVAALSKIADLDFDLHQVRNPRASKLDRAANAAGQRDVIVLYQHSVIQSKAMIEPATDSDGVLLEHSQSRSSLSRVDDSCAGPFDAVYKRARQRGDARQPLHQVQSGSFADQQYRGGSFDARELGLILYAIAVIGVRLETNVVVQARKDGFRKLEPAQHQILFCEKSPSRALPAANHVLRSDIASPQIFLEQ